MCLCFLYLHIFTCLVLNSIFLVVHIYFIFQFISRKFVGFTIFALSFYWRCKYRKCLELSLVTQKKCVFFRDSVIIMQFIKIMGPAFEVPGLNSCLTTLCCMKVCLALLCLSFGVLTLN